MIVKGDSWANRVRRLLFPKSHLQPYLPLLQENTRQKVLRLAEDPSAPAPATPSRQPVPAAAAAEEGGWGPLSRVREWLWRPALLDPTADGMLVWYSAVLVAIMFLFIEMGLVITYGEAAWEDELNSRLYLGLGVVSVGVLLGDVYVQFNQGYIYRGMIITDKQRAVERYVRSYLLLDLAVVLLFVLAYLTQNYDVNYGKLLISLKFLRLFELDEYFLRRLSLHVLPKLLYVVLKQVLTIFTVSHVIGLWFYLMTVAIINQTGQCAGANQDLCWVYSSTTYSPIYSLSWQLQYFYTLYWGVNTVSTISYGDIASNNPLSTIYVTFMMCLGFMVFGYVVNNIIKVILWARSRTDRFNSQELLIEEYMDDLGVSREVQGRVHDYMNFLFEEEKSRDLQLEQELKRKLPEELRFELVKSAYQRLNVGLCQMLHEGVEVSRLLFFLSERKYAHDEPIMQQGALVESLNYLHKGELRFECSHGGQNHPLYHTAGVDQFMTLYEFFVPEPVRYTITAERGSVLYHIPKHCIAGEMERSSDLRQTVRMVEYDVHLRRNFARIHHRCFYCQEQHHWHECVDHFALCPRDALRPSSDPPERQGRSFMARHNVLRERYRLRELETLRELSQDVTYSRIEKRIAKIRGKINEERTLFDVDAAHDWSGYLPEWNLSRLKEVWNKQKVERRVTRQMTRGLSRFGYLKQFL